MSKNKYNETAEKMKKTGEKMQAMGCLLTLVLTIPIVLLLFFGPVGLGVGVLIAVVGLAIRKRK